jgi:hypothetical protein
MTIQQFMRAKPGTAFLVFVVFLCLLFALVPRMVHAQTLRFQPGRCDWNLQRKAFDNYIGDGHAGGFAIPRWQHHVLGASLSTAAAIGLHKITRLPTWAAATIAVVGVGFVPHARGYIRGTYDINLPDWIADGWIRSAPAWYAIGHSGHSKTSHVLAATTYLAGYGAVACWASP